MLLDDLNYSWVYRMIHIKVLLLYVHPDIFSLAVLFISL